nr:CHAD domain-containing protein [Methylomarinum sp. Ch1-1]MDP4523050.1 CHAD domain-containing protein [Methylomarinum sp. Ch1-1]
MAKKPVIYAALELQGRKPADYSAKLAIQLDPKMRADLSCKYIYSHLLQAIKVNEAGTIDAIDSEFLHDFRVAVRRTRAGLSQLKRVLPAAVVGRNAEFFAWLGQISGPARDMDVYLLNFASYQHSLPEDMQGDLQPLYELIKVKQHQSHRELAAKLKSVEYIGKLQAWEDYLKESVVKRPAEADALLSIKQLADKRLWRVYRRVLNQGNAISDQTPPKALHRLRKTCKKLRYLMEFFQSLYPEKKIKRQIKALKELQDILGDFQDYQVQESTLKRFANEMMAEQTSADTLIAMGVLVQNLRQQRLRARQAFAGCFDKFKRPENQASFQALFSGKL